jgi:AraC-like DNA-binding protein/CheY-like chemotaxis protein
MFAAVFPGRKGSAIRPGGLSSTPNVLLVRFDKTETDWLGRCLGDSYHVFILANERLLLSTLEAQAIHVVMINTGMGCPQSGIELCSHLKSQPHFAQLIVILVIAANDHTGRIGALESGADAWMEQPLPGDHLRAQLNNLLANRRRLKACYAQSPLFTHYSKAATLGNRSFLSRLGSIIAEHLPDTGLNVDVLARLMNISRPTLYRKIRCISDRTPNELVNSIRLDRAAALLSTGDAKILEIAKMVGFHSRSNFGKAFVKYFGVTPMEYRRKVLEAQK